jgi:lipoprotein-anchoring transpeptidase ErfK/SrfK
MKRLFVTVAAVAVLASASSAYAESGFLGLFGGLSEGRSVAVAPNPTQSTELRRETPDTTRSVVADPTRGVAGAITVDTANRYLYLSMGNGQAMRYSVGVGREGFEWSGKARVGRMAEWPAWTPPSQMLKRRPDLPRHMAGGIDNPLGARAMYLYAGSRDTMFRIHGSNEPDSIGQAVSSGCIRMLNADVEDLYTRVRVGTPVTVL